VVTVESTAVVAVVDETGTVVVPDELSHAVANRANAVTAMMTRTLRLGNLMALGRLLRWLINL
jgi:regulator of RNase E activity RraA